MGNSTFIQIPADIADPVQLRRFLSKLILELDTAFGNRGSNNLASTDAVNTQVGLLSNSIDTVNTQVGFVSNSIDTIKIKLNNLPNTYEPIISPKGTAFNKDFGTTTGTVTEGGTTTNNPKQSAITGLNQTISDPPTQAEVQAISDKVDEILVALTGANII